MPKLQHSLALLLPAVLLLGGCFRLERQQLTHKIDVATNPPGAQIWLQDSKGKQHVGKAPVTVTRKHTRVTRHFNRWHWLWTALSGAATGVGVGLMASGSSSADEFSGGTNLTGLLLVSTAGGAFLGSLLSNLIFESSNGAVVSRPETVMVGASLPGHADGWSKVVIPGEQKEIKIALGPGREGTRKVPMAGVLGELTPEAAKKLGRAPSRPIVAVFRIQTSGGRFRPAVLDQLTDYLSAQITAVAGYRTVPRDQLRQRLSQQRTKSYQKCYEEACQIELGKALAAQKSLATRLMKVGRRCALTAVLYDLKSETAGSAASVNTGCSADKLMEGLQHLATKLKRD